MDPAKNSFVQYLMRMEEASSLSKYPPPVLPGLTRLTSDPDYGNPVPLPGIGRDISNMSLFLEPNAQMNCVLPEPKLQISLTTDPREPLCPPFMKASSDISNKAEEFLRVQRCESQVDAAVSFQVPTFSGSEARREAQREAQREARMDDITEEAKNLVVKKRSSMMGARSKYTLEEDELLVQLVHKFGENWKKIQEFIPGRDRKKLRDHYLNKLKINPKEKKFTPEEDELILKYRDGEGWGFSKISEFIDGASNRMVRNHYNSLRRKMQRPLQNSEVFKSVSLMSLGSEAELSQTFKSVSMRTEPSSATRTDRQVFVIHKGA